MFRIPKAKTRRLGFPSFTFYKVNTTPGNPPIGSRRLRSAIRIFVTNTGPVTATNIIITDVWDFNTYIQLQRNVDAAADPRRVCRIALLGPDHGNGARSR